MAIRVLWENEAKQVLLNIYEGTWSLDDFYAAVRESNMLMDKVDYRVNLIFDVRNSRTFPSGFMGAIRTLSRKPHPHHGVMVIVGGNAFVRVFYDVFTRVYPMQAAAQKTYIAANYEEARAIFSRCAEPR
ncbi:MAG: hypothetical protein HZC41_21035 [Chloroflexi bacterium]|nr:hypothetical protein [Chloroflexota bacterium]